MTLLENQTALPEVTPDRGQGGAMIHSESPAELIRELRANGFRVFAEGDKLHVTPTSKILPWVRDTIAWNKWAMIACLEREEHERQVACIEEIVRDASRELDRVRQERDRAKGLNDLLQMENHWLRRDAALKRNPASELDDDLLQKARYLTHPDKHGGSEVAQEVFVALQHIQEQRRARP